MMVVVAIRRHRGSQIVNEYLEVKKKNILTWGIDAICLPWHA